MSKQSPITKKKSLKRFAHVDVESVAVRETFGADELQAKQFADARGGTATDMLVRLAVVEHDGKLVELQPFSAFDTWNARTRGFVFALWREINGARIAETKLLVQKSKPHGKIPGAFVFDCSVFPNLDCKSFTLRETNGEDERIAAQRGERSGAGSVPEMVASSIVEVDGREAADDVIESYRRTWNTRTRGFVLAAWQALNSVNTDEIDDFLTSDPEPQGSPATTTSGSSGERG